MYIEFNGMITGAAEKRFWQKEHTGVQLVCPLVGILCFPIIPIVAEIFRNSFVYWFYISLFLVIEIIVSLPKSKNYKMLWNPQRIVIDQDMITCTANSYVESKFIDDVKEVRVHEEFYELVFPFGKISNKFMCQKSLLTKGSLAEFEELFKDKLTIVKK